MTHVKASRRERIGVMTFCFCQLDQCLAEDRRRLTAAVVVHEEIQVGLLLRIGAEHGYRSANKGAVAIGYDGKPSRVVVVVVGGMPSDGRRLFGGAARRCLPLGGDGDATADASCNNAVLQATGKQLRPLGNRLRVDAYCFCGFCNTAAKQFDGFGLLHGCMLALLQAKEKHTNKPNW